ncbi:MAG: hypothetical protein HN380_26885 [Victivallales bacterium]|jgi:hypothetical protein|nr:hypothetical protein [Victivallales bacterium]
MSEDWESIEDELVESFRVELPVKKMRAEWHPDCEAPLQFYSLKGLFTSIPRMSVPMPDGIANLATLAIYLGEALDAIRRRQTGPIELSFGQRLLAMFAGRSCYWGKLLVEHDSEGYSHLHRVVLVGLKGWFSPSVAFLSITKRPGKTQGGHFRLALSDAKLLAKALQQYLEAAVTGGQQ